MREHVPYLGAFAVVIHDEEALYHRLGLGLGLKTLKRRRQFPMRKMETLTPCKIETLEQIDTQFVRIDYVNEQRVCSKFGENPFTWDLWANG